MSGADGSATTAHEPGEEFAEIELTLTGNTGTGSAYINVDELGPKKPAYVSIPSLPTYVRHGARKELE